ncbi:MAG: SEC-C domain-containing protein [Candidatus Methylomirabilota bacterium]
MPPSSRLQRHASCPCGSGRSLSACCLPWEEAFHRLISRLVAFVARPRIHREENRAAGLFWNTERPLQPGKGQAAVENLRFLEWFLHDQPTPRGRGPLLGEFADTATGLCAREEALLLGLLLAPVRPFEVTESADPRGVLVVKDLLTGAERSIGPFGFSAPPIRSDVLICRLVGCGRLARPGAGLLILPAASREEVLAYVRTAYRMARPARHISLEDFLDTAAHLYHHYFLLRGKSQGGRVEETVRRASFAPGWRSYRGKDPARIRASLDRQMEMERQAGTGGEVRYAWIDPERAVTRATVSIRLDEIRVTADTGEDLTGAAHFLETCLRSLVEFVGGETPESTDVGRDATPRRASVAPGTAFFARVLDRWPDSPCPLLEDRTPREAAKSGTGRRQVADILLGLEREFDRLKRLGRAWADLTALREHLALPSAASPGPRRKKA